MQATLVLEASSRKAWKGVVQKCGPFFNMENRMSEVTKEQFEWDGEVLTHKPTGATFRLRSQIVNYGRAGETLADGECYERPDVLRVANNLVVERKAKEG